MDSMLCDELIQEIFTRIPNSSSSSSPTTAASVSLVSKRWLYLYRSSRTSLSLRLIPENSTIPALSTLLSHYPFLSSLSLVLSSDPTSHVTTTTTFSDGVILVVSSFCPKLTHLRFLAGPVSQASLFSLSKTSSLLTSLTISLPRPLCLNWVAFFSSLKELSLYVCGGDGAEVGSFHNKESVLCIDENFDAELGLESLLLSGIQRDDCGLGWLWRSCKKLKKLHLKNCEGVGDGGSFLSFVQCLQGLEEVELRTCRSIVDGVLLRLAENCDSLTSVLVYDGGCRDGLLQFISNCRCKLQKLDLRLPLDLDNVHLSAIAANFRGLSSLRLQSCCLFTGEGLKALGIALSSGLEELALINCDVVERESGLLATLGQNLKQLRKLDLSYNESLLDKEFISMLASCTDLIELKLRGCQGLSNLAMLSMLKSCKRLESIDIMHCCGIGSAAVESFLLNAPRLKQLQVEESKVSDVARIWAANKFIQVTA
ncbi:hypothetical protein Tsubulata_048205 [Turnera subulata]|uniref:F-box domain-containing protein n=1 Tax=Turnera subulata TaxID=218843 RepID=A0A9Q0J9S5_9ROSI|nr:hypothetical protein Tsubulata_048205 [Turnera subulata]